MLRIERPDVEVLDAVDSVDVVEGGALAERDAEDPLVVDAPTRSPLVACPAVCAGYLGEPGQIFIGYLFRAADSGPPQGVRGAGGGYPKRRPQWARQPET